MVPCKAKVDCQALYKWVLVSVATRASVSRRSLSDGKAMKGDETHQNYITNYRNLDVLRLPV